MMTIRHAVGAFGVLAGLALAAPAQQPKPPAEPSPKDNLIAAAAAIARGTIEANVVPGSFRAQLVVDDRFRPKDKAWPVKEAERDPRDRTGKMHCLVCENGLAPVVAVFVRSDIKGLDADSGLGKLVGGVDSLIPKYSGDKLSAFVMFLKLDGGSKAVVVKGPGGTEERVEAPKEYPDDEKRGEYAKEILDFASKFIKADRPFNVPFGLAPVSSPAVTAFGIGDTTPVTVIIYDRMRMAQRWDLKTDELTDAKVAEILAATERMVTAEKK